MHCLIGPEFKSWTVRALHSSLMAEGDWTSVSWFFTIRERDLQGPCSQCYWILNWASCIKPYVNLSYFNFGSCWVGLCKLKISVFYPDCSILVVSLTHSRLPFLFYGVQCILREQNLQFIWNPLPLVLLLFPVSTKLMRWQTLFGQEIYKKT